jgi:hypothetical protein
MYSEVFGKSMQDSLSFFRCRRRAEIIKNDNESCKLSKKETIEGPGNLLTRNIHLSLSVRINRNGVWTIWYMKYETKPLEVIPAEAGRELCSKAYDGHMAVIIWVMAVAPPALWTPNQKSARIALDTTQK